MTGRAWNSKFWSGYPLKWNCSVKHWTVYPKLCSSVKAKGSVNHWFTTQSFLIPSLTRVSKLKMPISTKTVMSASLPPETDLILLSSPGKPACLAWFSACLRANTTWFHLHCVAPGSSLPIPTKTMSMKNTKMTYLCTGWCFYPE